MATPREIPLQIELPAKLEDALASIAQNGGAARIVGGSVRDALLGKVPKDFDVEVYGLELNEIQDCLKGHGKTDLTGQAFAVVKLWAGGYEYDFSVPRSETKQGDGHRGFAIAADKSMSEENAIQRRDFTINALLYDPEKKVALDYCGGYEDLEGRRLRHVGPAFVEDPLRVLRGMQLAGRFGLTLDAETAALCKSMRPSFWTLPHERIWEEWRKWACRSDYPSMGLRALQASGWLSFFSELYALVGKPHDPEWHPEGDVWEHICHCVDALRERCSWDGLPDETRLIVMIGTLCHDLGKARRTSFAQKGDRLRWLSPGHDHAGSWLCKDFLPRIGAPKAVLEKVPILAARHHCLNSLPEDGPSDKQLRRLAKKLVPATMQELWHVMIADHYGRLPATSIEQEKRLRRFDERSRILALEKEPPKPILLGRHLIAKGHQPGPAFKAYLDEGYEAQLEGAFEDETGAVRWLEDKLQNER